MTSGLSDTRAVAATGSAPRPAVRAGAPADVAVLMATSATADGSLASLLAWEDTTVLGRLAGQLADLGVPRLVVITRPAWQADVARALNGAAGVEVRPSPGVAEDLLAVAELARGTAGPLVVAHGDIVTQHEALARLLLDPRVTTGILAGGKRRPMLYRVRGRRGRVISAGSPYHGVHRPSGSFLGVVKVVDADLGTLADAAERVAPLSASPPASWLEELERKAGNWRAGLARRAAAGEEADDAEAPVEPEDVEVDPADIVLSDEDEALLRNRLAVAPDDAVPLLLVGLVRGGARVGASYLRRLFWARPLSPEAAAEAEQEIKGFDEERALLASAVKASDGFFTTFFVSPYSRYIARWAARRELTPNQVTTVSLFIGLLAAAAFATGERWGLIAGAVLLQIAFTTDCVDGQLARYTRQFSKLGAWLDSVFDRTKEYLAFAGLAIGASRAGDPVWLLACAAITLQTARHMSDFAFGGAQQQEIGATPQPPIEEPLDAAARAAERRRLEAENGDAPPAPPPRSVADRVLSAWQRLDRTPGVPWLKKMVVFPIGERFALISVTAALFTPHVTFIALLAWGGLAAAYTQTGRVLRSIR